MVDKELTIHGKPVGDYEGTKGQMLEKAVYIFSRAAHQFESREKTSEQQFLRILKNEYEANGAVLEQKPEHFVRQYLVYPLLDVLEFEYIIEPRMVFDSIGYGETGSFADFRITNASYVRKDGVIGLGMEKEFTNQYKPNVFGETKPLNNYEEARDEIEERYVGPHMEIDVGIATDGLDWGVYISIPYSETWTEFSLRRFAMKVANHVYNTPVLQESYPSADEELASFLGFFHKPNFEHFLLRAGAGVMWEQF
jgi:hypothetical protein